MCEEAQERNGLPSLLNVFYGIRSGSLPVVIDRFSVVSAVEGHIGDQFRYRTAVRAPSGEMYGPAIDERIYVIRRKPEFAISDFAGCLFVEYGLYTIDVEVDGEMVDSVQLAIYR
jgi:hypothetical protein